MTIDVYTFCWNEEIRLPYFLKLWSPIARRIIIYDNGSTDKSKEIALSYSNVVWDSVTYNFNEIDEIKLIQLKNNCWKQSRDADFCFVGDCDEIIHFDFAKYLVNFLYEMKQCGLNLIKPFGYNMVSSDIPMHKGNIWDHEDFKHGVRGENFDKRVIFSPKKILDINFRPGAHMSNPTFIGNNIKQEYRDMSLKLLHYKFISKKYYVDRQIASGKRLNKISFNNKLGIHYLRDKSIFCKEYDSCFQKKKKIIQ